MLFCCDNIHHTQIHTLTVFSLLALRTKNGNNLPPYRNTCFALSMSCDLVERERESVYVFFVQPTKQRKQTPSVQKYIFCPFSIRSVTKEG